MNISKWSNSLARATIMVGSLMIAAAWAVPASAGALDDIKDRGAIRLGILGDQPPFGYVEQDGSYAGYDVDFGKAMAADLGVETEFVPMSTAARIGQLTTGKVDAVIAIMGMYPERAEVVQFSKPYAALNQVVLGWVDASIDELADLADLRIGVTRGSAPDVALSEALPAADIRRFDTDATTIQAFVAGQVDVIGANSTFILNIKEVMPDANVEEKLVLNPQYMGIAMRLGDKAMNEWANQLVDKMIANGELEQISQTWLGQALPEFPASLEGVPFTVE